MEALRALQLLTLPVPYLTYKASSILKSLSQLTVSLTDKIASSK